MISLLWQATLTIEDNGPGLITGTLSGGGDTLNVRGAVELGCTAKTIQMRATGISGTPTDGWIYDYSGALTYHWPEGDAQRPAIVGTVTRTLPHAPNRRAGESYSFVAVNQDIPISAYKLPDPVVAHFAEKVHRLHTMQCGMAFERLGMTSAPETKLNSKLSIGGLKVGASL